MKRLDGIKIEADAKGFEYICFGLVDIAIIFVFHNTGSHLNEKSMKVKKKKIKN